MIVGRVRTGRAWRGTYLAVLMTGLIALLLASAGPAGAEDESASGEGSEVVVCNEANGSLLTVSSEAISQGTLDFPFHVATEAEIAANACGDDGDRVEVVVCNEANGKLLTVSREAVDQGTLDFPFHLATDAEVAAGTCGDGGSPSNETDSGKQTVSLPNTGSGTATAGDQSMHPLAVTLLAGAGMLLMLRRRLAR